MDFSPGSYVCFDWISSQRIFESECKLIFLVFFILFHKHCDKHARNFSAPILYLIIRKLQSLKAVSKEPFHSGRKVL